MSSPKKKRFVVIGGGIAGLAALYKLQELSSQYKPDEQPDLLLLEAGNKLGGSIQTIKQNDCLLELGPDSFITQKPWALDLCNRLGLSNSIIPTNEKYRRTFVVASGKLHPVPEGFMMLAPTKWMPFVWSPIFSPFGKLRMAMDLILPKQKKDYDESLSDFVSRRLGKEALEKMAQPMIGGIYTACPTKLSLKATMPKFIEYEQKYGSVIRGMMQGNKKTKDAGARYSLFVSLEKGMQTLVAKLIEKLSAKSLYFDSLASKVIKEKDDWAIFLSNGERVSADGIILATPAYVTTKLLADLDSKLSSDLQKIEYATSVIVNFIYNRSDIKHALDGFGFVVPAIENMSIIACTFSSIKFEKRATSGKVVLRVFLGGALNPQMSNLPDDQLVNMAKHDLEKLLGISGEPLSVVVAKHPRSMPQYHVGHLDLIANIKEHLAKYKGLALAGNAYSGVGIPDCIYSGEMAAESVFQAIN